MNLISFLESHFTDDFSAGDSANLYVRVYAM